MVDESVYKTLLEWTGSDHKAAAMLYIASMLEELPSNGWSREICIGIRKGLFGVDADDSASIDTALTSAAETIKGDDV